jgi:nucleotide-binding universal stress UspA family protein
VVGVDGRPASRDALAWGCGEAARSDGEVIAVFVSPSATAQDGVAAMLWMDVSGFERAIERQTEEATIGLRRTIRRLGEEAGVDVGFVHAHGDVSAELLRIALETGADVIAVGRSTGHHRLFGSPASRLARRREAPIVVVVP